MKLISMPILDWRHVTLFTILVNLSVSIILALKLNVWTDEAYSLYTSGKDLSFAIYHSLHFERLLPLYFVLLNLWRSISSSPFWSRLFSSLCIAITIYYSGKLARKLFTDFNFSLIVISVAINPFIIWAAVEIRLYAFMIMLSAIILLLFYDGYIDKSYNKRSRHLYILVSILSAYTHQYLILLLIANAFALIVFKRWESLRSYIIGMVIVVICFLPMIPVVFNQIGNIAYDVKKTLPPQPFFEPIITVYRNVLKYVLPCESFASLVFVRNWIFRIGIPILLYLAIRNKEFYKKNQTNVICLIWSILCIMFIGIVTYFSSEIVRLKHTAILFLPSVLCFFKLIEAVKIKKIAYIYFMLYVIFSLTTMYFQYTPMAKIGDWYKVARYLMESEKANQSIFVFRAESVLPLKMYYDGINKVIPIPSKWSFDAYALNDLVIKDEQQLLNVFHSVLEYPQDVWLVTDNVEKWLGVNFNRNLLENFIKSHFEANDKKVFYGSQVRFLHVKAPGK